jgi:hypothetical protein
MGILRFQSGGCSNICLICDIYHHSIPTSHNPLSRDKVATEKNKITIEAEKDRTGNMRVATDPEQVGLMRCTEES